MSPGRGGRTLLLGGLGSPHDVLAAAALEAQGARARPLGTLDADALSLGQSLLPRGQCAPILHTTGALARELSRSPASNPLDVLSMRTCGPCRYALFEPAWERALAQDPAQDVRFVGVDQSVPGLLALLGEEGLRRMVECLAVADVLRETAHRIRPRAARPDEVDRLARAAGERVARLVARRVPPIEALAAHARWHSGLEVCAPRPLARVVVVGEPWSLHVEGDGQLNLPQVLARAGAEVEIPPAALWIAYLLWQARGAPFGRARPLDAAERAQVEALDEALRSALARAARAAGLGGFALPDLDALAALAAPYLPSSFRGGYGHLEVGLAVRARVERRAHLVVSVKSFGCIPSSGVSDAVIPTALGDALPYLALEVCADGESTRESRLALRLSSAIEAAAREVDEARAAAGPWARAMPGEPDPLEGRHELGARRHACTLACQISDASARSEAEAWN